MPAISASASIGVRSADKSLDHFFKLVPDFVCTPRGSYNPTMLLIIVFLSRLFVCFFFGISYSPVDTNSRATAGTWYPFFNFFYWYRTIAYSTFYWKCFAHNFFLFSVSSSICVSRSLLFKCFDSTVSFCQFVFEIAYLFEQFFIICIINCVSVNNIQ